MQPDFSRDPHRPRYHLLPPANWMNDPNGVIHWKGRYHMFYQHNPNGAFWGTMHWGHAVSDDLVHWEHLPIALAPTPDSYDADGCFSGVAVVHEGVPTFIYSGFRYDRPYQVGCVATAEDDDLVAWRKHPANPVIAAPPPDLDISDFRDHAVWREGDTWYQVMGAAIRGVGGAALLYRSDDLVRWEYLHPLAIGDALQREPVWTGTMWECPLFLDLGQKHALLISAWDHATLHTVAMVGRYADHRFMPETTYKFDYGDNYFYAPQHCIDENGRALMWGWLQEGRTVEADKAAGWSGVMSLPRVVTLREDGLLGVAPPPELEQLRGGHALIDAVFAGDGMRLMDIHGDCLELSATFVPMGAERYGLVIRCSPDGVEQTRIVYDRTKGWLGIDSTRSSLDETVKRDVRGGPLALAEGEPLQLRVFLDASTIEVFANDRVCVTGRIYPTRSDSMGVGVFAENGWARVTPIEAWQMRGI